MQTFYFDMSVNLVTPFFLGEDIQITLYGDSTDINVRLEKNCVMLEKTYISLATYQKVAIMNRSDSIVHYQWKNFGTEEEEERDKLRFDLLTSISFKCSLQFILNSSEVTCSRLNEKFCWQHLRCILFVFQTERQVKLIFSGYE